MLHSLLTYMNVQTFFKTYDKIIEFFFFLMYVRPVTALQITLVTINETFAK